MKMGLLMESAQARQHLAETHLEDLRALLDNSAESCAMRPAERWRKNYVNSPSRATVRLGRFAR